MIYRTGARRRYDRVGLIDTIITAVRVLATRDLTGSAVVEALADLRDDEDVAQLILPGVKR